MGVAEAKDFHSGVCQQPGFLVVDHTLGKDYADSARVTDEFITGRCGFWLTHIFLKCLV